MGLLFVQCWDIIPGKMKEYEKFVMNEYNPTMSKLNFRLVGGYYTVVGEGPRITAVAEVESLGQMEKSLSTREYRRIYSQLSQFVWKYISRVWSPVGRFRESPYTIQTGVWKFNQYYNILRGKEDEHYTFVKEECFPVLEELGVPITGAYNMVIGSGSRTLSESTARNITDIAKAIGSSKFRKLIMELKNNYATDYSSRILASTGRIEVPYLIDEMMKNF